MGTWIDEKTWNEFVTLFQTLDVPDDAIDLRIPSYFNLIGNACNVGKTMDRWPKKELSGPKENCYAYIRVDEKGRLIVTQGRTGTVEPLSFYVELKKAMESMRERIDQRMAAELQRLARTVPLPD